MVKPASFKILWDRKALDHFKEALSYLQKQSDQAPKIVKVAILAQLKLIKANPFICELDKLKSTPNNDFRAFIVFSFRVTYQIIPERRELRPDSYRDKN